MNIKQFMDDYLSADVSEFYSKDKNSSRLSPLQKAVIIFNSTQSKEEKTRGYRELIATGEDDVINDKVLHIPYFAMARSIEKVKNDFPAEYKNGQRIFDYGDGEVCDINNRAHIYKGWSSLLEYLLLLVDGKPFSSKYVSLGEVALNLFLKSNDGTSDFVWKNGEILIYQNTKLVVYGFSLYPNGAIKYKGIQISQNGICTSYSKYSNMNSRSNSNIYGDDDIYHASRINKSDLNENEAFLIEISEYVALNPQTEPVSLCRLLDAYRTMKPDDL